MNPISNEALCATKIASPTHSLNSVSTSSISGASTSISSVMWVKFLIVSDNFSWGLLKRSNLSMISPSCTLTAASSIILSYWLESPVVSTSKTTYVADFKSRSVGLYAIGTPLSTSMPSMP